MAQVGVLSRVNFAPASLADFLDDFVVADGCPDQDSPTAVIRISFDIRALGS